MNATGVPPLRLEVAMDDYLHTQALFDGRIAIDGLRLNHVRLPPPQIFARFLAGATWEVAEMSMGKLVALRSRGEADFIALPVFPHRVFRHAAFFVRADSELSVEQLDGKRIGVPEWTLTAAIYARALLMHQYRIPINRVSWVQAGLDAPRRASPIGALPAGVTLYEARDATLPQLLLGGEIDVMIAPHAPAAASAGRKNFKLLFEDFAVRDTAYWRSTGIFPIMHAMVMRRQVETRRPGTAGALIRAFGDALNETMARLTDPAESATPVPFLAEHIRHLQQARSGELWHYGVEANRTTLTAFLDYCHEQGVSSRRLTIDELFA